MSDITPCEPIFDAAVGFNTSTATANVQLPSGYNRFLVIVNGADAYIRSGTGSGITATPSISGHMYAQIGTQILTIQDQPNGQGRWMAGITASGTGFVQFVPITGGI